MKIKLNGDYLPIVAGIVQAVLFSVAGDIYFQRWYMGAVAGIIPSLSLAFGSSRVSAIQSPRRRYLGYGAMALALCLSPVAVAPALWIELSETILESWVAITVAVAWASLPDLSIVFAAVVAGKSLFSLKSETKPKQTESTPKPTKPTKHKTECRFGCGWSDQYQTERGAINATNSHEGKCRKNPLNKPLAVDLFEGARGNKKQQ